MQLFDCASFELIFLNDLGFSAYLFEISVSTLRERVGVFQTILVKFQSLQ